VRRNAQGLGVRQSVCRGRFAFTGVAPILPESHRMSVPRTIEASQHPPGQLTRDRRPAQISEAVDTPPCMGVSSDGAVLVRPDGFVAWRSRHLTPAPECQLEDVLSHMLCLPNTVELARGDNAEARN
jgi:Aromatic-ring hydroxylase, C-terminal